MTAAAPEPLLAVALLGSPALIPLSSASPGAELLPRILSPAGAPRAQTRQGGPAGLGEPWMEPAQLQKKIELPYLCQFSTLALLCSHVVFPLAAPCGDK